MLWGHEVHVARRDLDTKVPLLKIHWMSMCVLVGGEGRVTGRLWDVSVGYIYIYIYKV